MRIAIYGLMLTFAGCATTPPSPPQPTNWDYINAGMQRYQGHDVRELAAVIGYPDSQRVVMGDTVYVWRSDVNMPVPNYSVQTTTGMVGSTPYYQTTSDAQPSYVHLQCTIEVVADANGLLSTYHLDGQNGACWKYARALASR